jgi:energy-coupling factor transporter ATP-binding protein EcfA2
MSLAGRILAGIFGLAGVPFALLLVQQGLAAPGVAIAVLVLYEVVILLGAIVASVAQQVVRRRVEQVMDFFDLALGRRVSRYARYYRRYVLERDRHINARDLAHTPSHIPELDAVYVDVGLAPGSPTGQAGGLLPASRTDQSRRQSIHEFLDQERPAVCAVIGAPGSGKSTLLRHTARLVASQGKERLRRIPVMLALRDHADALTGDSDTLPTLAELIRSDIGALSVTEPLGWWEAQLRSGNCLILLDGLDEVARSEHRAALAEWIEKQIAKHPKNDFVITSRPHGYQTAVIPQATVLQVRPFTTDQIRQFVVGWCRAAERHATGSSGPEIDQRADEEADDLLAQLYAAPALMELAVNPLLLTMMVLVHRERRSLPAGRADLYNQVCDVMLWRRLESKKMEVKPPGAVRQRILASLAYDMMVAETRDYPRSDVLAVFDRALAQMDTDISAEDLLTAIVESSGLLVEREKDQFAFAHHTIGEYLASTHIRSKNLSSTLIRAVGDPWWRETTLLYVTDADANEIVKACLEPTTSASLALAFDCLRSHGQINRHHRDILNRLMEEAFEDDVDPELRSLVARALATGHLSNVVTNDDGTLICPNPIPEHLYWLFCKETGAPLAEGISEARPDPTKRADGIWRRDAAAFITWINSAALHENAATYRLPTTSEVEFASHMGAASSRSGLLNAAVWMVSDGGSPRLWTADGSGPWHVKASDLRDTVEADLSEGSILVDIVLAGALLDARTVAHMLTKPPPLDLQFHTSYQVAQVLFQSIGLVYDLVRNLADRISCPTGLDIDRVYGLASILTEHFRKFEYTGYSSRLAGDLCEALSYPNDFAPDLSPGHYEQLDSGPTPLPLKTFGIALTNAIIRTLEVSRTGSVTSLVSAVSDTLFDTGTVAEPIEESLDPETLLTKLRSACGVLDSLSMVSRKAFVVDSITTRLLEKAQPLLSRKREAHPDFATPRMLALMASAEAVALSLPDVAAEFSSVAAGITLLERRAIGRAPREVLVLVRE